MGEVSLSCGDFSDSTFFSYYNVEVVRRTSLSSLGRLLVQLFIKSLNSNGVLPSLDWLQEMSCVAENCFLRKVGDCSIVLNTNSERAFSDCHSTVHVILRTLHLVVT